MNEPFDILILGGGPIAASSAYFLTKSGNKKIGLVTQEPIESRDATYLYAGGSVRWFWPDALKTEMTTETAMFIKDLQKQGVDLSLIEDNYLFLNRGKFVPSVNISSKKLIQWLLDQSIQQGLSIHNGEQIESVQKNGELWQVKTDKGLHYAKIILSALGVKNSMITGSEIETEKRELFVLNLPVTKDEEAFPHTIVPINEGVVYVFIKQFPEGKKFVVGQEDVVEEQESAVVFAKLIEAGLGEIMPFLKEASVENILWGFDVAEKNLILNEIEPGKFVANCGSAIRACVWIGRTIAEKLSA